MNEAHSVWALEITCLSYCLKACSNAGTCVCKVGFTGYVCGSAYAGPGKGVVNWWALV